MGPTWIGTRVDELRSLKVQARQCAYLCKHERRTAGPASQTGRVPQFAKLAHRCFVERAAVWRDRRAGLLCRGCGSRRGACWRPDPRRLASTPGWSTWRSGHRGLRQGRCWCARVAVALRRPSAPRSQMAKLKRGVRMSTALAPRRSGAAEGVGAGRRPGSVQIVTVDGAGHSPACSRLSASPPRRRAWVLDQSYEDGAAP